MYLQRSSVLSMLVPGLGDGERKRMSSCVEVGVGDIKVDISSRIVTDKHNLHNLK